MCEVPLPLRQIIAKSLTQTGAMETTLPSPLNLRS